MNIGKTLFAQLMDFLPWKTFHRIVERCDGGRYVKSMTCADQFRVMAFAQLTCRESLRDIEACLSAQRAKRYHMGLRQEIKRVRFKVMCSRSSRIAVFSSPIALPLAIGPIDAQGQHILRVGGQPPLAIKGAGD